MHPQDLRYHKEHTWIRISGNKGTIGITDYAQDALGDIVYIDLPEVDSPVEAGTEMSEIESTKSTSSVISPMSGRVLEVNEELSETPEIINDDPYGKGWIAVIELDNPAEADDLLDANDYRKLVDEESK
ncbi:MAG: glycine cleavage system protein GcvH [Nitrospirae bacterium]|nr:glycine cleavage system protein GcvH [Nitrospirota bacterium]